MSRHQDDTEKLKYYYGMSLRMVALIVFPTFGLMASLSEPLILTLIGEKWSQTIPYLRILCIVGALWAVSAINLSILRAIGKTALFFRLDIVKKIIIVITIAITYRYGIEAMIWGQVCCAILGSVLNLYFTSQPVRLTLASQLLDILNYLLLVVPASLASYWTVVHLELIPILELIIGGCVGGCVYLLTLMFTSSPYNAGIRKFLPDRYPFHLAAKWFLKVPAERVV